MGSTLEALLELQDVELQIVDIRRQLARRERQVRRQNAKLRAIQEKVTGERDALRRTQVQVDEIDMDLKGRSAHVTRLREHLNSVKTNKEYAAVLAQLNTEKADASRLETRALQMMEGIDAQRKAMSEREELQQDEAARLADLQAQSERAQRTFAEKLTELEAQREQVAGGLGPRVITLL